MSIAAVLDESLPFEGRVNTPKITQAFTGSDGAAYRVEVRSQDTSWSFFDKESKDWMADGTYQVVGHELVAVLSTGDRFFSIPLDSFIPADGCDYELESFALSTRFHDAAFIVRKVGTVLPARLITSEDANPEGKVVCNDAYTMYGMDEFHCQRELGHLGAHQEFRKFMHNSWTDGGGRSVPKAAFGVKTTCPGCQQVLFENEPRCSSCEFWKMQLSKPGGFIIEGTHYRPGKGGFDGHEFKVQTRNGIWTGELMTQGEIPVFLKSEFPDNASFVNVEEEYA